MPARHRRPSLLGGLLWTTIGVLFLLRNFGIGPDFWSMAQRYWPILLILFGLGKVIDYYRQSEGVSLRVGEVVGVLILVVIGSAITRMYDSGFTRIFREMPIHIRGTEVRPGQWFGNSHTYSQEATYPVAAQAAIRIDNSYGAVTVSPGSEREVRVRLRKIVFQDEESRAKQIADEIRLEGGPEGQTVQPEAAPAKAEAEPSATKVFVVTTNRESLSAKDYRFNTDLEVLVPKSAQVQIRNSFGEIRASGLEGKLEAATSHHPVDIRDCTGEFTVSNRYSETRLVNLTGNVNVDARGRVYVETLKGDLTVRDEYSPVEISGVDGKVTVTNTESSVTMNKVTKAVVVDARGTALEISELGSTLKATTSHRRIQISDVASDVQLESRYQSVTLKDIKGNVDVQSNSDRYSLEEIQGRLKLISSATSVRADGVRGPVEIQTSLKDVVIDDFSGPCKVTNEYGDVRLSTGRLGKGEVTVKNKNGAIELFIPAEAAFQIDASARNGRVESDFQGLAPVADPGGNGRLNGKVKSGGTSISLETEYNNIRLGTREPDDGGDREPEPKHKASTL